MFGFLKKKKNNLFAPATGDLINLDKVADPVFSTGMMGAGYAVEPANGDIYAPVEAKIISIFPTKHAIGLKTKEGQEILIHLGIDTVELEGEGFEIFAKEGEQVDATTKLVTMDLAFLKEKGKQATVMVLIPTQMDKKIEVAEKAVVNGDVVGELE